MISGVLRFGSLIAAAIVGGLIAAWFAGGSESDQAATTGGNGSALPAAGIGAFMTPMAGLAEVTQMPAAERIRLGGYVEASRMVKLTAQAPGRVTYVAGDAGDRVASGQVVVALDDDALRPNYRAAWADLSSQMTGIQDARTQLYNQLEGPRTSPLGGPGYDAYEQLTVPFYNMAQSMFGSMFPGMNGFNSPMGQNGPMLTQQQAQRGFPAASTARAAYERQLSQLAASQSRLDGLDAQLRNRRAMAPWQGAILTRYVRVGDIVQPGQPLADIADVDQLDVRVEVPVALVANLRLGDAVPVTVNDTNHWALVSQIHPAAQPGAHTVTVKLTLPAGAQAAPGMYVLAWIAQPGGGSPSQLAPAVPNSAIVQRGSLPVAFVARPDGTVEMRVLRLGDSQGSNTAVLSGLAVGEHVVAQPSPHLKSGDPIHGGPSRGRAAASTGH
ncbi:efflux RND transporter periplasmic adaptor subunit [Marimonas arenosa]|uniref:Efflux RND transporter periplasmic adaptor subunit n=1 Tax=Marimonas arenosa TaxID=1795305 RepID=A0AAE4B5B2_9RHOB|nr:efflux RND transporter periplasmic adaptor subunit [Marimonas arenosa]MDQ2090952.1 efflux RND transporter periplasmic adaptor subunit [Marimonas arenosa]